MFRASLCPSSGEQRSCYYIWCVVLVLLDVVGSGCGALRCRMRAVLASYNAAPHRSGVNNKHLIVTLRWCSLFIFISMFVTFSGLSIIRNDNKYLMDHQSNQMMPQKCWRIRCRTLRRSFECVSGKKDFIRPTLLSVFNLVRTLKMH